MKRSTSKSSSKKVTKPSSSVAAAKASHFDFDLVREFTSFMKDNDLVELDLRSGDREIRLKRGSANSVVGVPSASQVVTPAPVAAAPARETAAAPRKYHVVTSPFVGTFYRAPGPNQDNFVEEGQTVGVGETLCIVEAMKLMNEIESEIKGRVVKILVSNGTPVEFGEALFEIDPL